MHTAPWWLVLLLVLGAVEATWVLAGAFFRRVREDEDDAVALAKEHYAAECRRIFEAEKAKVAAEKQEQRIRDSAAAWRHAELQMVLGGGDCAPEGREVS